MSLPLLSLPLFCFLFPSVYLKQEMQAQQSTDLKNNPVLIRHSVSYSEKAGWLLKTALLHKRAKVENKVFAEGHWDGLHCSPAVAFSGLWPLIQPYQTVYSSDPPLRYRGMRKTCTSECVCVRACMHLSKGWNIWSPVLNPASVSVFSLVPLLDPSCWCKVWFNGWTNGDSVCIYTNAAMFEPYTHQNPAGCIKGVRYVDRRTRSSLRLLLTFRRKHFIPTAVFYNTAWSAER